MTFLLPLLSLLTPPALVVAAPQETFDQFRARFDKAVELNSKDEIKRIVNGNEMFTIYLVMETCEAVAAAPSERISIRLEALVKAWADSKGGDFVRNMERYFSRMNPPAQRERQRLRMSYDKAVTTFTEAEAAKEKSKLAALADDFKGYAEAFEQIEDGYYAGMAWFHRSLCLDERHQGPTANLRDVAQAYRKFIDSRNAIDLKDRPYREVLPSLERLEGLGFGAPAEGGAEGAAGAGAVATPNGAAVVVAPAFEPLEQVEAFSRPNYFLDEHFMIWDALRFGAVGSKAELPARITGGPAFYRSGANRVELDSDGDGKGDVEVPTKGNLEVFEVTLGPSKRKWAFFVQTGTQVDQYQGVELSNLASDDNWSVYILPATSTLAEVGGVRLQIYDDNMDGICGSAPQTYGHIGLSQGVMQPELDSLRIGDSKRAQPWSEYVKLPSGWTRLQVEEDGAKLTATPLTMRTGKLKLDVKGVAPTFLVVRGMNDFENAYFDLAGGKEVEVPVGRYQLYWGVVTKGAKRQLMKALVLPTEDAPTYEVTEGKTVAVKLGAPYDLTATYETADESVTVVGKNVAVLGSGGERYERFYLCVPRPEASYRKKGTKKASKPEEMSIIQDRDGFDRKGGYAAMWKPLDLVLPKRANETEVEVQLTEKKNKLFGKIDGNWR